MDFTEYQQARETREPCYDGVVFVASKTAHSFCRSVCPVIPAEEHNVEIFETASEALLSGYQPCLKCRPESSPFLPYISRKDGISSNSLVEKALTILHEQGFKNIKLVELAERLNITDRYLRKLFETTVGMSPKGYIQHQQALFAKALLYQTHLPINQIALASGYNNVRRFNDGFKRVVEKTPSQVRKLKKSDSSIRLQLHYQPPYDWEHYVEFITERQLTKIEAIGSASYSRTFSWPKLENGYVKGWFSAVHRPDKQGFNVTIEIEDIAYLFPVIQRIRQVLDLTANVELISQQLKCAGIPEHKMIPGLRLPTCWSRFEASVRAVLGQQVSVKQATSLVNQLVEVLGETHQCKDGQKRTWFPTPEKVAKSRLHFLKIPDSRKATLKAMAKWFVDGATGDIESALDIKGVGNWTVDYIKMRGDANSDIWLESDLGIKKALDIFPAIEPDKAKPYRSYLTFTMWHMM